jgi:adenine-specific DNA methylase
MSLLMASLINSRDKVANTCRNLLCIFEEFKLIDPINGVPGHSVLMDANELVKKRSVMFYI